MGSAAGNNEASEVLVSEAHDALDTDSDGKVTKKEFMTAHKERYNLWKNVWFGRLKYFEISDTYLVWFDFSINKEEITSVGLHDIEQNFVKHLDVDHDGILDMSELTKWVEPDGFQGVGYINRIMNSLYYTSLIRMIVEHWWDYYNKFSGKIRSSTSNG